MRRRLGERGVSFVDLLVGSAIGLVVAAGAVTVVRSQTLAMRTGAGQLDMNDAARGVVEFMAREIRLAGYNPGPRCLEVPSPVTAIVAAGPQMLRVQYVNENDPLNTADDTVEDVLYQYDADSMSLRRTVGGEVSTLATDVPADGFQIRYFDSSPPDGQELIGTGPGAALSTGPASQAEAVRRLSLRFAPSKTADARTTTTVRAPLWTNVSLRNREYHCQ